MTTFVEKCVICKYPHEKKDMIKNQVYELYMCKDCYNGFKFRKEFEEVSYELGINKALKFYAKYTGHYISCEKDYIYAVPDKTSMIVAWGLENGTLYYCGMESMVKIFEI